MVWLFIWLMVGLKIPIFFLGWIVWKAIHAEPVPPDGEVLDAGGGGGPDHPRPRRPRPPRRGPHAEPLPAPPVRIRAVARRDLITPHHLPALAERDQPAVR